MNDLEQFVEVFFCLELLWLKKWVVFSLTSFGTFKYDCVIKTREMFNFLPLINKSVTFEFSFLLLIISAIIPSKTINIFCSLLNWIIHLFFQILNLLLLVFCMDDLEYVTTFYYAVFCFHSHNHQNWSFIFTLDML